MIAESLVILAVLLGGSLTVRVLRFRGWPVPAIGYAVGVALLAIITALAAIASVSVPPWVPVALTVLGPTALWLWLVVRGADVQVSILAAAGVASVAIGSVAAFRAGNLVNLTPDSYRYLSTGGLLANGRLEEASPFLLESRLLTVPAMHAPAALSGELYLRSVTPLLAVSCVLILVWIARIGLRAHPGGPSPLVVAVTAGALLLTTNRFVFHAFYLNGHMAMATWLLLLGGVSWLALRERANLTTTQLVSLQVLIIPAVVLTRPEAGLMVGLLLLPLIVVDRVAVPLRWVGMFALGASMIVWQGFLAVNYRGSEGAAPTSVDGLFVAGVGAVLLAVVITRTGVRWIPRRVLGLTEGTLWLAVIIMVLLDPATLSASARATIINLVGGDGGWGSSLIVLAILAIVLLAITDVPERVVLRFPLTTFVPLAVLLAYLRGNAYRVGGGDSLNRMLIHLVPLTILFVVAAFEARDWGWRWRRPPWRGRSRSHEAGEAGAN